MVHGLETIKRQNARDNGPQGGMPRVVFLDSHFANARALTNPLDIKRALNSPWSQKLVFHEGAILVIGKNGKDEGGFMKPVAIPLEAFEKPTWQPPRQEQGEPKPG